MRSLSRLSLVLPCGHFGRSSSAPSALLQQHAGDFQVPSPIREHLLPPFSIAEFMQCVCESADSRTLFQDPRLVRLSCLSSDAVKYSKGPEDWTAPNLASLQWPKGLDKISWDYRQPCACSRCSVATRLLLLQRVGPSQSQPCGSVSWRSSCSHAENITVCILPSNTKQLAPRVRLPAMVGSHSL